jgi:polyisoprenoid-binding protein YceI
MGLEAWDKHMRGEDFFNVEQFPKMTFKSTRLTFDGDKLMGAEGELTLARRDQTGECWTSRALPAARTPSTRRRCAASMSPTTIKRSDFGMTKYLPGISDIVYIEIPVEAFRD